MRIMDRGTVFHSKPDTDEQSCAFPGICVLPSGRWIATCRAAPTNGARAGEHTLMSRSDDEGKNWSEPAWPFTPSDIDGTPGVLRGGFLTALGGENVLVSICWVDISDPSLAFFNEETQGLLDTRIFHAWSSDGGQTWTEPVLMDTTPYNCPTPPTGPALLLSDGRLASHFELNKHYYDTTEWRHSSVMMFSSDGGKTWPEHVATSNDPDNRFFYWDQRPGVLADGTLLDTFWTYDNKDGVYLNIHARESKDNGRTWSELWDTGLPDQPAPPVSTPDGGIALVYMDRRGEPIVKMRKSTDGGRTWPDETEIVLYQKSLNSQTWNKGSMQDAWAEMGKFSVGLPATARLPDGDILTLYYAGPETDRTDVQWVRVRP